MVSVADGGNRLPRRPRRIVLFASVAVVVAMAVTAAFAWPPRQRFANYGDFRLQNGETIADLVVGYRTAGELDASRSNAVLVAPWMQGTSGELARQIGPGKLVDTSTHFVIMVDALGNGVSSSPSNSTRQPAAAFPSFTIGDMVETQRRLVTETLQIKRLQAVVGISMGGMQAFEWTVAHPELIDKAVAIVGSPKSQPDDLERLKEGIQYVQVSPWTRARTQFSGGHLLAAVSELRVQPYDYIRQAEAMIAHDISKRFDGSMERTAAAIGNRWLLASTWGDRSVNPKPAFELARLSGATIVELDGRCGHMASSCERATVWLAVRRFLDRPGAGRAR
jgi:homoserine acetyltransferase